MDPLSVSASINSLIGVLGGALKASNEFSRDFRDAPTDITSLAESLQSLMGILDGVVHENIRVMTDSGRKQSLSFQALIAIGA